MLFFKGIFSAVFVSMVFSGVRADTEAVDGHKGRPTPLQPFNNPNGCGMTPFLYSKVVRSMINIIMQVAANLPGEIPNNDSNLFFEMVTNLVDSTPCREESKAISIFLADQPKSVSTNFAAKTFAWNLNNFYLKSIGLPADNFSIMDKNFQPTFIIDQSESFFEFMHLLAMKLPEDLDKATRVRIVALINVISSMLPGNRFTVFLKKYIKNNSPLHIRTGSEARQYFCEMHNAFSASGFLYTINCANLDKYYGPNTIAW